MQFPLHIPVNSEEGLRECSFIFDLHRERKGHTKQLTRQKLLEKSQIVRSDP